MPSKPQAPHCPSASALSATLYLMSRIALRGGGQNLSPAVIEHLALLTVDPCLPPTVRMTTRKLFNEWQHFNESMHSATPHGDGAKNLMHETIRKAMSL